MKEDTPELVEHVRTGVSSVEFKDVRSRRLVRDLSVMRAALDDERGPVQRQIALTGIALIGLLLRKNRGYGNTFLTSKVRGVTPEQALLVRAGDKTERMAQMEEDGGADEVGEDYDETLMDYVGYSVLRLVQRSYADLFRRDRPGMAVEGDVLKVFAESGEADAVAARIAEEEAGTSSDVD